VVLVELQPDRRGVVVLIDLLRAAGAITLLRL
jgi:hypothetical protein